MIFLDTHIVIRLYDVELKGLSKKALELLDSNDSLYISPMVMLELQYMHDIKRIKNSVKTLLTELEKTIRLQVSSSSFRQVADTAINLNWTRDPFDRLITAEAMLHRATLITADRDIRKHYSLAVW